MKYRVAAGLLQFLMFIGTAHSQVVMVGQEGKSGPTTGSPQYCAVVEAL